MTEELKQKRWPRFGHRGMVHTALEWDHVTLLLKDLKWINFNRIFRLNEATFMYKNLYIAADENVKNIYSDLRN